MLCLCTIAAYGQQSWQGNAAVARAGEFAAPGMFAASNAFPEDTIILVQNAQTGQSAQVTVTQRIQGTASVFLLLSEEAGKQIGLTGSQVIRVQASVVSTLGTELSESLREEPYTSDPDLNPPLSVTDEQLVTSPAEEQPVEVAQAVPPEPAAEQEVEASGEEAGEAESETAVEEEQPGEEAAEEAVAAEEQPVEPEVAAEPTPEEKRLQELEDRIPQKQLYMPPRQQEIYALAPEPSPAEEVVEEEPPAEEIVEVEEEIEAVVAEEEPEEAVEAVEEGPPRVSMSEPEVEEEPLEVALPGPEAAEPEKPSPEGTRLPAPEEETPLTMAPEEPPTSEIEEAVTEEQVVEQPSEEVTEVAMAEAAAEKATVLSDMLPSQTYFVQLGAYSTRNLAENLAGDLTQSYSVTILPADSGGRRFYKVLVGPLNVDESGTLLYQFRSRGFKDAFIQYVE
jgi:rare lipoprotein A (peptidoglycan hydrolase)